MNLQRLIERYISYQRSLGSSFRGDAAVLRAFGRARGPRASVASVRVRHVDAFLGKARPVTRTWFDKLSCLRGFFRYAVSRGYATTAPLPTAMPKRPPVFVPYIYTREEIRRLLQAIEPPPHGKSVLEPATIRTMILVYYGAGLRLGEAINLTRADVDLSGSLLTIRNTKFGKTRLVPVGPQLTRVLVQYDRTRPKGRPADGPLFRNREGRSPLRETARTATSELRVIAQASAELTHANNREFTTCAIRSPFTVSPPGISRVPTCSDSCTNCRSIWATSICRHTQVYLSMTPELLREASQRFERYAGKERHHA